MKKVQTPLFQGITENEWNEMQNCSCMRQQSFEKNELIFRMGESVREIGIVLTGSVNIENVDLWGNKSLLSNISAGQVFAETYAFCQEPLMVNAVAAEYTNLLFLNLERSALSKELGKMRDEGILEFRKSQFVLHQLPE